MVTSNFMERVNEINDPRLDAYRNLKQDKKSVGSNDFIAEGRFVVERLISSEFKVQSLLVSSDGCNDLKGLDSLESPVYHVSRAVCEQLVGFPFHRGIMACGERIVRPRYLQPNTAEGALLVCCPDTVLAEGDALEQTGVRGAQRAERNHVVGTGQTTIERKSYESPVPLEKGGDLGVFEMGSTVVLSRAPASKMRTNKRFRICWNMP